MVMGDATMLRLSMCVVFFILEIVFVWEISNISKFLWGVQCTIDYIYLHQYDLTIFYILHICYMVDCFMLVKSRNLSIGHKCWPWLLYDHLPPL